MSIPVFILAAGASRRLGQPKQLVRLAGEPLIRRQCRVAIEAALGEVFAILGDHADACRDALADLAVKVLFNPDWSEGLAASLRTAAATAAACNPDALLLLHVDQYALSDESLRSMVDAWRANPAHPHLARDGEHLGPPAVIPRGYFSALQMLQGDCGARRVLGQVVEVPLPGAGTDIDDPSQLPGA